MQIKTIAVYKKEEEIKKITNKLREYKFRDFKKTGHFEFSILEKATDEKLLIETFPKFNLIKTIELRENPNGQQYYGFNYELKDKTFVVIVLALDKIPPWIINGYHKNRDYKKFEKQLRKNYAKRFI